jgi:hypothetical protein
MSHHSLLAESTVFTFIPFYTPSHWVLNMTTHDHGIPTSFLSYKSQQALKLRAKPVNPRHFVCQYQLQLFGIVYKGPGLGLLAAPPPPLFMSPAKKVASASLPSVFPPGEVTPGEVGSGVSYVRRSCGHG